MTPNEVVKHYRDLIFKAETKSKEMELAQEARNELLEAIAENLGVEDPYWFRCIINLEP